jgi:hypothetical protein
VSDDDERLEFRLMREHNLVPETATSAPTEPVEPQNNGHRNPDQDRAEEPVPEPIEPPSSWRARDLTAVLEGIWSPPEPTVGRRTDGRGLLYAGKSHMVIGETEAGKGWFALVVSFTELDAGHHVLYVDFEDDEGTVVGRLMSLGAAPAVVATLTGSPVTPELIK